MNVMARWVWERTDPRRSGSSGDIAKLFRHETVKQPGVFAQGPPSEKATLMAREVIQNSWDAAREQAVKFSHGGPPPPFALTFRFKRLLGPSKRALAATLDLESHATRIASPEVDRVALGLSDHDCLDHIRDDATPLDILEIVEENTTGMYGSWSPPESHMYFALVAIGYTEKAAGAGGSYGYGKAGLIAGSKIRSVLAYTCFAERSLDPTVTRRLLGMTYWGQHKKAGASFTGFARFGERDGDDPEHVRPFENDAADSIAKSLGLRIRDPGDVDDEGPGTSFLLVDPTVGPHDLVRAIERSWWPAIIEENGNFSVSVVDHDGTRYDPRPKRDPVLRTFIDAWEIAQGRSEPRRDADHSSTIGRGMGRGSGQPKAEDRLGRLALVSDLTDWSYADQVAGPEEGSIQHRSLVALTRGPRMVVEYFPAGQSPPYVRGAFIADPQVDDLLRRTEPKAHDAWRPEADAGDVDGEAADAAATILKKIKSSVNNHRQRLKPPVPKAEDVVLPHFNAVMRRVLAGSGKGVNPPIADVRPVSIRMEYGPEAVTGSLIRVSGTVVFSLSEHHVGDDAMVEVSLSYRFIEDDRVGEPAALLIRPPDGSFVSVRDGVFRGKMERDQHVKFAFETEPYDADWSGRLVANASIAAGEGQEGSS